MVPSPTDAGPEENDVIIIAKRGGNNSQVGICSSFKEALTFKNRQVRAQPITMDEKIGSASTNTAGVNEPTTTNPPSIMWSNLRSDICQIDRITSIGNIPY